MKTILYKGSITDQLTKDMTEGVMTYHWQDYTFVRREGTAKSFEQMGMEVKDFSNWTEATVYLKELFADYADQYPELFAKTDWYNVDSSEMYPLINKWAQDNSIPYAGWQDSNGNRYGADGSLVAWLPVRVGGEFACVGSDSDDKGASFYCGNEGDAHLSVSFRASDGVHEEKAKLKPVSQTYNIDGFTFIIGENGISILGEGDERLWFKNSKKSVIKKFRQALDKFCDEMDI